MQTSSLLEYFASFTCLVSSCSTRLEGIPVDTDECSFCRPLASGPGPFLSPSLWCNQTTPQIHQNSKCAPQGGSFHPPFSQVSAVWRSPSRSHWWAAVASICICTERTAAASEDSHVHTHNSYITTAKLTLCKVVRVSPEGQAISCLQQQHYTYTHTLSYPHLHPHPHPHPHPHRTKAKGDGEFLSFSLLLAKSSPSLCNECVCVLSNVRMCFVLCTLVAAVFVHVFCLYGTIDDTGNKGCYVIYF